MSAKRNGRRRMWVGAGFKDFAHDFKKGLEKSQGRKYSDPEVTNIIANFNKKRLYFKVGKDKVAQI